MNIKVMKITKTLPKLKRKIKYIHKKEVLESDWFQYVDISVTVVTVLYIHLVDARGPILERYASSLGTKEDANGNPGANFDIQSETKITFKINHGEETGFQGGLRRHNGGQNLDLS